MTCAHCWRITARFKLILAIAEFQRKKISGYFRQKSRFLGRYDMLTLDAVCRNGYFGQVNTFRDFLAKILMLSAVS